MSLVMDRSADALVPLVSRLVRDAVSRRGVPLALAEEARRATTRRFAAHPAGAVPDATIRRYFWGTVRRMAMRSRGEDAARLRQLLVLASIARDLREGGRSADAIRTELSRQFMNVTAEDIERAVGSALAS